MPVDPGTGYARFTPRTTPAPDKGASIVVRPTAQGAHNHGETFVPTVRVTPRAQKTKTKTIPGGPAPGPSAKDSVVFLTPAQIEQQAQQHAARMAIQRQAQSHVAEVRPAGPTGSDLVGQHPAIYSPRAVPAGKSGAILPPTGPTHDIYSRMILKQMATMRAQDPSFAQLSLQEQEQKARGFITSSRGPVGDPTTQWNAQQVSEAAVQRLKNEGLPREILDQVAQGLIPVATAERLIHGKAPTLGSVASDIGTGAAWLGPDELLAPVRAVKAGLSAYREAGVSVDSVRAAKAALDARKGAKQAKSVFALDLKTNQARKDYAATLNAAGYSRQERKSILAAHDASALAMARDLGIKPSDAWDQIYAHTQFHPVSVTTKDVQTGRVVFAQEGQRPEITNLAHTPEVVHPELPSPSFFKNAARRLIPAHTGALPEQYNTPTKFAKLLDELRQRAIDAAQYKSWYSNSAQAIMAHVAGNTQEADKLAALVAIYSPRAEVYSKSTEWNNLDRAINAYNEFHAQGEISPRWSISSHKTGEEDWQTTRAQQVMQGTFDWHGLKTNRFYRNFLQHIDPEKYASLYGAEKFGTMDTWMRRAFKYPVKRTTETEQTLLGPYERAVGKAQEPITPKMYSLMEKATQVIADSLGWSPEEAQAAIWTSIKAEQEGTPLSQAGFDFRDAFAHRDAREKFGVSGQGSLDNLEPETATAASELQKQINAVAGKDLKGLPKNLKHLDGKVSFRSSKEIQDLAHQYMRDAGLRYDPPTTYAKVDPERATRIAQLYDEALHAPSDPAVVAAYDAMIRETLAQYKALEQQGYTFEFYPPHDPYPTGPRESMLDIQQNRHMYVFPTEGAFGTVNEITNHPLLAHSGVEWGGKPVTHNDLFRAVHDVFGHSKEGVGFRADGEENAWRSHSAMYSPNARRAMTSETRGQNSWVNYGPHGEANRTASQEGTVYADQKAVLLPEWVSENGANETASVMAEHAGGVFEKTLAEAAAMMGKKVPKNGTLGNRADRAEVLNWIAHQARTTNDPEIHAVADMLDAATEAMNSPDPEFFFQQDNPLLRQIADEQGKPMLQAAAMQVRYGGVSHEVAAAQFGIKPEELRAYLDSGQYEKDQARILSNQDVGAGPATTTEDAKTILDRAEGKDVLPQAAWSDHGPTDPMQVGRGGPRTNADLLPAIPIKGAVARTDQGEHILALFKGADVSTAIHELGHAVEQYLPESLRASLGNDPEAIARTFEQYFMHGGIPDEKLRPAMEHLAEQMTRIYAGAESVPGAQINPEIKAAFDDFFTREIAQRPAFAQRLSAAYLGQGHNWRWPDDITGEARALAEQHGVNPEHLVGTGVNGRVTIPDVEKYVFEHMSPEEQLRSLMRGLRVSRGKQEAGYSIERSARFKNAEGHYLNESLPPEERLAAGKSELAGELPKVVINGRARDMTQDALDHLLTTVLQHPNLMTGHKTRVADALVGLIREGRTPTRSELSLMRHVWGRDTVASLQEIASKWDTGYNLALSALNIPRSIMSSMDVSFGLRQALVAAFYDPKTWFKAWRGQFEYLSKYTGGGEAPYQAMMEAIHAKPNYPLYEDMQLAITDLEREIGVREEPYQSNLAEKLTIKGHGPGSIIRSSGRMYTGMAVMLRTELADKLLVEAAQRGQDIHDTKFLQELGHFINGITGRGDLPGKVLQESAPLLNALFFSPRLLASRVQMLNPRNYIAGDKFVRRQYLRAGLRTFGTLATVLGAIKLFVPGAIVGTDWRSSDFGKIKVGDTRIDIGGGFNQLFHLAGMIYTGQKVSSTTGQVSSLTSNKFGQATRMDAFINFFSGKLAPTPAMINDWAKNRDPQHLGQPFNWKDEAASHFQPLIAQDAWQLYNDPVSGMNGIEAAAAGFGLEATGMGIQTYKATDIAKKPTQKLEKAAKDLGLPAPTPDILLNLDHKTHLDSLVRQSPGDRKAQMKDIIKYYETTTGDKSFERVAALVQAKGTNTDASQIIEAIRHAMVGPSLSQYEKAVHDAQKVATP